MHHVVICLKIRTFVVSATTRASSVGACSVLWFAWKFVPLWYQQQLVWKRYLIFFVVICLKIRTFVVSATTFNVLYVGRDGLWFAWKFVPLWYQQQHLQGLYLAYQVVICLKIRTFVVSATTSERVTYCSDALWFAWKFVPLWYQQQPPHPCGA